MKPELEEKLFNDFPVLYGERVLPVTHSLMGFGFECGDGWYDLIHKLSEKLSKYPDIRAIQVKEKYGGLRYYVHGILLEYGDEVYKLIDDAEEESLNTCEKCGAKENVTQNKRGWIYTLCDKCREENEKAKNQIS